MRGIGRGNHGKFERLAARHPFRLLPSRLQIIAVQVRFPLGIRAGLSGLVPFALAVMLFVFKYSIPNSEATCASVLLDW